MYLLIYLAVPGLLCNMQDLWSSLQRELFSCGKQILSCSMWTLGCGMWDLVPWPGIEPWPLYWEHRVLTTGPPGNSPRGRFRAVLCESSSVLITIWRQRRDPVVGGRFSLQHLRARVSPVLWTSPGFILSLVHPSHFTVKETKTQKRGF